MKPSVDDVLAMLRAKARPDQLAGMARYGINPANRLAVSAPDLYRIAKAVGKHHALAFALWRTGIADARGVAALVAEPARLTGAQMDRWVRDFDSWDVCDGVCLHLFDKSPLAWTKVVAWAARDEEFVRRAAFALIAGLASHDKTSPDARFVALLPLIEQAAVDPRNYVKKAVNWALRGIGKRNLPLNRAATTAARRIKRLDSSAARWVASDALRELTSAKVRAGLERRKSARRSTTRRRAATARHAPALDRPAGKT